MSQLIENGVGSDNGPGIGGADPCVCPGLRGEAKMDINESNEVYAGLPV